MPATRRRTQRERSEATRKRLLEATLECLVARGYAQTSTTEICRRAGVSRGAQLHHYPRKTELVAAAVEHVFEVRRHEFRQELARLPDSERQLSAILDFLWSIYRGPTLAAWLELVVAGRSDPELGALVADVDRRFTEAAESTFREIFGDAPPDDVAAGTRLVLSVMDGLALNAIARGADRDSTRTLRWLKSRLAGWTKGQGDR